MLPIFSELQTHYVGAYAICKLHSKLYLSRKTCCGRSNGNYSRPVDGASLSIYSGQRYLSWWRNLFGHTPATDRMAAFGKLIFRMYRLPKAANQSSKYLPFIPAPRYRGEIKTELRNVNRTFSNAYIKFGINHFFQQDKFSVLTEQKNSNTRIHFIECRYRKQILRRSTGARLYVFVH